MLNDLDLVIYDQRTFIQEENSKGFNDLEKISQPFKSSCGKVTTSFVVGNVFIHYVELFFRIKKICNKTFFKFLALSKSFISFVFIYSKIWRPNLSYYIYFFIRNKVSHIITNASNYTTLLLPTIYRKYS